MSRRSIREWAGRLRDIGAEFAGSGPLHRRRLADIQIRIAVTGVRGKSTAVQWLHQILFDRGYDTYGKVTGTVPASIYKGFMFRLDRPETVRLYENERQLRRFGNIDAAIVENQGLHGYTTRLVNEKYVRPHVAFMTNVREDHLDTLGESRPEIARSLARAIPRETQVVCGEQNDSLLQYLEAELDRRDASLTPVEVPPEHDEIPGSEVAYGLNPVLEAVDEPPLRDEEIAELLEKFRAAWTHLAGGRVFDAAAANDPQSTELIRRYLTAETGEVIQPLAYLREDRPGRTATFRRYLQGLADRGAIEQARVVGPQARLLERHVSFPVIVHDETAESPDGVLEAALADGWPVVTMANAVPEFMQELGRTIERGTRGGTEQPWVWGPTTRLSRS